MLRRSNWRPCLARAANLGEPSPPIDGHGWNLIHNPTVTKIDLIMRGRHPFDDSEFHHRAKVDVGWGRFLYMKSAEDSVLRKLLWYRAGGEVSDRQWRDVLGILRHARPPLDDQYLNRWAEQLLIRSVLDGQEPTLVFMSSTA